MADVAHELRTPLTVLQGNLRALLDDVYPLDKAEVARLYDQTRHLAGWSATSTSWRWPKLASCPCKRNGWMPTHG